MTGTVAKLWPDPDRRLVLPSRGLRLAVCEWGDPRAASTVVVATHGYLDSGEVFGPLVAELMALGGDVAVAALTFAGHGDSEWADSYGWCDHVVDVLAFLRRYRRPNACTVALGHSFGAIQLLDALSIDGRDVDLFVNLDAVSDPKAFESSQLGVALAAASQHGRRELRSHPDVESLVARRLEYNPRLSAEMLRPLVEQLSRVVPSGRVWKVDPALVGWVRPWDLSLDPPTDRLAMMAALPFRSLVVTGSAVDDPRIRGPYPGDAALAAVSLAAVSRVDHVVLPDAGHYVHLESPRHVAEAMAKSIADLSGGGRG